MNKLVNFTNDRFSDVRVLLIDNEPWFVGKDVAKNLGYINPSKALSDHVNKEDKLNNKTLASLGQRGGWLINESGLYSLILSSKLPTAKDFKRWVTSEILPAIRKTGGYIPTTQQDDDLTIMAKAHKILERTLEERNDQIAVLQPKADVYDHIMSADGTFSMNQVAKMVGMGEYKLFDFLRVNNVLFYQGKDNVPYERFRANGSFVVVDTISKDRQPHSVTRATQKGVDYISKLMRKCGVEPEKIQYYAGYKKEAGFTAIAVFQTEQERDEWVECAEMKKFGADYFDEPLFKREPLSEQDVVQRFNLNSANDIKTLKSYEDETEPDVRYLIKK